MAEFSDEEIVGKITQGEREIFGLIIDRYKDRLGWYVASIVKDDACAVDVLQEVFLKAYVNLKGFDVRRKFSTWIYRIAHNEALNAIKKKKFEVPLPDDLDLPDDVDVERDAIKSEEAEMIKYCLKQMPVIYAEPIFLYYMEERSYEEISDILQLPAGTVAVRLSRAKSLMRKLCQKK